MFDKRNKLSAQVDFEARKFLENKVYQTVIPRNVRLSEAPSHGTPVLIYDKTCLGNKISVKLSSTGQDHRENLSNLDYLVNLFNEFNLELVSLQKVVE